MTFSQILLAQLADPFRIALIVGLVFTMFRTRAATGTLVPLMAGVVFVAVILPVTMQQGATEPQLTLILSGLVANLVILGVVLGIWEAVRRIRGG